MNFERISNGFLWRVGLLARRGLEEEAVAQVALPIEPSTFGEGDAEVVVGLALGRRELLASCGDHTLDRKGIEDPEIV